MRVLAPRDGSRSSKQSCESRWSKNRKLSTTDDLTRWPAAASSPNTSRAEVERATRYGRALALILCDIDHFKNVNDTLGTQAATRYCGNSAHACRKGCDAVSIGLRASVAKSLPIVLPETNYEQALDVRAKVAKRNREQTLRSAEPQHRNNSELRPVRTRDHRARRAQGCGESRQGRGRSVIQK